MAFRKFRCKIFKFHISQYYLKRMSSSISEMQLYLYHVNWTVFEQYYLGRGKFGDISACYSNFQGNLGMWCINKHLALSQDTRANILTLTESTMEVKWSLLLISWCMKEIFQEIKCVVLVVFFLYLNQNEGMWSKIVLVRIHKRVNAFFWVTLWQKWQRQEMYDHRGVWEDTKTKDAKE